MRDRMSSHRRIGKSSSFENKIRFIELATGTLAKPRYAFFKVGKRRTRRRRARQLDFAFASVSKNSPNIGEKSRRGGFRRGAGRPPSKGRRNTLHRVRESHSRTHPLHVVMRSVFRPLRSQFVFPTVRTALAKASRRFSDFRVVHFSVQHDHLHLIVEADTKHALSRGMQGLAIRIAKQVNMLVNRKGKLWGDRFFSRPLTCPRTTHHAIAYVLGNFRKHARPRAYRTTYRIDPYSSAPYFTGFAELAGSAPIGVAPAFDLPLTPRGVPPPKGDETPLLMATTWLAKSGWKRAGAITFRTSTGADQLAVRTR